MKLTPTVQRCILHWGEMAGRWGVSRSVAQIHALLFLSPQPLIAEEIAETLAVARSNVSVSLKELQQWDLVSVTHVLGDRRDYFQARKDIWEVLAVILDGRKKREIDPTVQTLRECVAEAAGGRGAGDARSAERLVAMLGFFDTMESWYDELRAMPLADVQRLVRMGSRLRRLLGARS